MKIRSFRSIATLLFAAPLSAATYTVDSTGDEPDVTLDGVCATAGGTCTLRAALREAAAGGADTVAFDIAGPGPHTIALQSRLPAANDADTTIDGYTQPGSQPNTTATGGLDAVPLIVLTSNDTFCLEIGGDNTVIRGLVINGCSNGIDVADNFGSTQGVVIAGNFLGTDPTGTSAVPNFRGIRFNGRTDHVQVIVGGPNPQDRNLISGNERAGIVFGGLCFCTIQGNVIGLDKTATNPVPNGRGIEDSNSLNQPAVSSIGGPGAGEGNIIAGNAVVGVVITNTSHKAWIRANSIYDNGGLGIDLGIPGVTPNDSGDADTGPDGLQNFPIIKSVEILAPQGTGTRVQGILHSTPDTTYELDFFENPACTNFPREFLEGRTYIGSEEVTTDGVGTGVFDVTFPAVVAAGARITATATDPDLQTSEFSQRIVFSITPASGPPAGGTAVTIEGTDFAEPLTVTIGGAAPTGVTPVDETTITASTPALGPGTSNDIVVTTPEAAGTLIKGWVSDFLDVPPAHIFHAFVVTLVSNGITVGVGDGSNYGVSQDTLRQQMAVFLIKAKNGLCFVPPPCTVQVFDDVPCSLIFAPWINELVAQGITGGCAGGGNNYCPASPVLRQQMAALLLRTLEGTGYAPPACTVATFTDVPCSNTFAPWIYELVARGITAGCGGSLYCPASTANRGQMATFIVKTFGLQ